MRTKLLIRKQVFVKYSLVLALWLASGSVMAGDVEIVDVKVEKQRANWTFHVTLKHGDTGWEHYADASQVTSKWFTLKRMTKYMVGIKSGSG